MKTDKKSSGAKPNVSPTDVRAHVPAMGKILEELGRTGVLPLAAGQDPTKQKKLTLAQRRTFANSAKILDEYYKP